MINSTVFRIFRMCELNLKRNGYWTIGYNREKGRDYMVMKGKKNRLAMWILSLTSKSSEVY